MLDGNIAADEAGVVAAVHDAAKHGASVRSVGAAHSHAPLVPTEGVIATLAQMGLGQEGAYDRCILSAFLLAALSQVLISFNELYDFRVSSSRYERASRFVESAGLQNEPGQVVARRDVGRIQFEHAQVRRYGPGVVEASGVGVGQVVMCRGVIGIAFQCLPVPGHRRGRTAGVDERWVQAMRLMKPTKMMMDSSPTQPMAMPKGWITASTGMAVEIMPTETPEMMMVAAPPLACSAIDWVGLKVAEV